MVVHIPCSFFISDPELAEYFGFDVSQLLHEVFHVQTCPAHARHRVCRSTKIKTMHLRYYGAELTPYGGEQRIDDAFVRSVQILETILVTVGLEDKAGRTSTLGLMMLKTASFCSSPSCDSRNHA